MLDTSLFGRLKRIFSTDVLIRNVGGNQLKVMDTERIQQLGTLQTNSLFDRYNKIYTTTGGLNFNRNSDTSYPTQRIQLYTDYEMMDQDSIIDYTLDIIADVEISTLIQKKILHLASQIQMLVDY